MRRKRGNGRKEESTRGQIYEKHIDTGTGTGTGTSRRMRWWSTAKPSRTSGTRYARPGPSPGLTGLAGYRRILGDGMVAGRWWWASERWRWWRHADVFIQTPSDTIDADDRGRRKGKGAIPQTRETRAAREAGEQHAAPAAPAIS
ncbi:hypothetical protein HYALB_00002362 [Hymenoscyphus albidus]|uniref:Uncharacterized protein n=1 Tax=Hymenoscyphus albidus TaxID=595503 RepID=A0A9N9LJ14_9HELO|nr:hypothetical protein HYALB_00002362 [Hymenoscyphus albidus]